MMKILVIILIVFHSPNWVEPIPIISNLQTVMQLGRDIGDILSGNIPLTSLFAAKADPIAAVMKQIDGITEQLDRLDSKLDDLLATLIARLPLEDSINTDIRDLQSYLSRIDYIYDYFLEYSSNITNFDSDTLEEFVFVVTSVRTSAHSDAGQSTMPFMDSRPVAPTSPIAFDGLGIAYRGHKKFGGFIILKPMTIDFTNYFDSSMTPQQKKYYYNYGRQPRRLST